MRKILIAVPCMDSVPAPFAHSLAALTSYGIEGVAISIWFNVGSLVYASRNEIAKRAIMDGADYVMWFDSDMVFPPDTLQRMLKHDKDIVCGNYYRRKPPYHSTMFRTMDIDIEKAEAKFSAFDEIPEGLFEVGACGFGCVLMKTDIFLAVFAEFGNLFSPIGNIGEDVSFCWRARQLGFKIYCDPSIPLGHVGTAIYDKEFYENYKKGGG